MVREVLVQTVHGNAFIGHAEVVGDEIVIRLPFGIDGSAERALAQLRGAE